MIYDAYKGMAESVISPSEFCFAITPDDVAELPRATKALYVGQEGNIALLCVHNSEEVTFINVPAGSILDLRVRAVRATGTTASGLVGLA